MFYFYKNSHKYIVTTVIVIYLLEWQYIIVAYPRIDLETEGRIERICFDSTTFLLS